MKNRIKYFITSIVAFILSSPVYAKGTYVTCGSIKNLPYKVLQLSNTVVNIMQIAVPVSSQKEDDIKKAQGLFIKRLVMGALVFFIFVIVKLLISAIGGNNDGIWGCVECFINNASNCK